MPAKKKQTTADKVQRRFKRLTIDTFILIDVCAGMTTQPKQGDGFPIMAAFVSSD